ncbi:hypothetical protein [Mesorhizobium sp. M0910]|uniref:hypothetical protein n=1 Tax=Mesorhizobium sp. M0910 TaxID=2957025 RepID=UPI00333734DD
MSAEDKSTTTGDGIESVETPQTEDTNENDDVANAGLRGEPGLEAHQEINTGTDGRVH